EFGPGEGELEVAVLAAGGADRIGRRLQAGVAPQVQLGPGQRLAVWVEHTAVDLDALLGPRRSCFSGRLRLLPLRPLGRRCEAASAGEPEGSTSQGHGQ